MKLVFEKTEGSIQVSLNQDGNISDFSYPVLIEHLYLNRDIEDSEFVGDDITPEEQASVNSMVDAIKAAVLEPQPEEDDQADKVNTPFINEDDISF